MTIKEVLELTPKQISGLSDKELRKVTQQLADAGNKRIRRLLDDPLGRGGKVAKQIIEEGTEDQPYFSIKGKTTRSEVKAQFDTARQFLETKSQSSLRTIKKTVRKVQSKLKQEAEEEGYDETDDEMTDEEILADSNFWKALDQAREKLGMGEWERKGNFSSTRAIKMLLKVYRKQKAHQKGRMARALAMALEGKTYRGKSIEKGAVLSDEDELPY